MAYSQKQIQALLDKTDSRCHLCREDISLKDYGDKWEVDHGRPRAKGGSSRVGDLWPACKNCNRSKGARSSRSCRKTKGLRRAPRSAKERSGRAAAGAVLGLIAGMLVGGPVGALIGALIGALLGYSDSK